MNSSAAAVFGAPAGIAIMSNQRLQPSSGRRHSTSSRPIRYASPDQPTEATTLPLVRSSVYSLPVTLRI